MHRKIDDINEIHKLQLQLIKYFDSFCKENNLKYFLAGGTLLGAARHEGFIPWDDDIDIAMPRPDYEKLLDMSKQIKNPYMILDPETNKNYMLPFAKFVNKYYYNYRKGLKGKYGIRMDIFPLDGLGQTEKEAIKNAKHILFKRKFFSMCFKENIFSKLLNKINFQKLAYKNLKKEFLKNDFYNSEYVASIVGGMKRLKEVFPYKVYSETSNMKFEDTKLSGMKYYDDYLSKLYGDYMKMPPENQRENHGVEIYDMRGEVE